MDRPFELSPTIESGTVKYFLRHLPTGRRCRIRNAKGRDTGIEKSWVTFSVAKRVCDDMNNGIRPVGIHIPSFDE
jgi:hypothetical protein